jgi:hypothetical protein
MQLNVFISDVHLECIPKFHVTAMRLIVHINGNEFNLLGIWSSNLKIIRFQEIIHANTPAAGSVFISFGLIALLGNDSESRVIGSGDLSIAVTHDSVNQTVKLSSKTMDTLMAQLQLTISFDELMLSDKDNMVQERPDLLNQHPYSYPHLKISNVSPSKKVIKSYDYFGSVTSRGANAAAVKSTMKQITKTSKDGSMSGYESHLAHTVAQKEVAVAQKDLKITDTTTSSSGMKIKSSINSALLNVKGFQGVVNNHSRSSSQSKSHLISKQIQKSVKDQVRDKRNLKVTPHKVVSAVKKPIGFTSEIRIHPEVMKQNEACDRLKAALEKKEEMLEKAQSQLDSSIERSKTYSRSPSIARYEEIDMLDRSNKREVSFRIREAGDLRRSSELRNRLKLAEERRMNILKNTKNRAFYKSSISTNKSAQIRDSVRKSVEIERNIRNKFDQEEEDLKIMEMKIDLQLRNSVCAMRNVDKKQRLVSYFLSISSLFCFVCYILSCICLSD